MTSTPPPCSSTCRSTTPFTSIERPPPDSGSSSNANGSPRRARVPPPRAPPGRGPGDPPARRRREPDGLGGIGTAQPGHPLVVEAVTAAVVALERRVAEARHRERARRGNAVEPAGRLLGQRQLPAVFRLPRRAGVRREDVV